MSDEIQKAQQMALKLKVNEIIENVVTKAGTMPNATKAEWEGCQLCFEQKEFSTDVSVVMPNGLTIYKAEVGGLSNVVTDFRYGSWVEKLKTYSEQITAEKQRAEVEKAAQEKKAKLAPFAEISDDEFEKAIVDKALPF